MSVLDVKSVGKTFLQGRNRVQALGGVNLNVAPGEFVAIMGPSGCGKSTLLHLIAGLTGMDQGTIQIDGEDISKFSDKQMTDFRRLKLGVVFQAFNLIPSLTAEENIKLPASHIPHLQSRVDGLLERLGMAERRHHRPNALSGGEQQRVAIARSLVCDPSLILADEPTGSLDSTTGQSVCELLNQISIEENKAIVLVTHEPSVARWAQRVVVLKDGLNVSEFIPRGRDSNDVAAQYQEALSSELFV